MRDKKFTLTSTIKASPRAAYRAFTTNGGLLDWFCNSADVYANIGRRFFTTTNEGYRIAGEYAELEEFQQIAIKTTLPELATITIHLQADNGTTTLTLEYTSKDGSGLETHKKHWRAALKNLKSVLETGLDKRVFDQPMLGVIIGGTIDDNNQARYGLPFNYGIIITELVRGLGAEKVGIQPDDVLVKMGETDLVDFPALQRAIAGFIAGDVIDVEWYRGGEKHAAQMTLAGRPKPKMPESPKALAEEVRGIYQRIQGEMAELFDGVSEEEADYRPAEGEWSAKEVVAHILATEKAAQLWTINTTKGRTFFNWATNDHLLVESFAISYGQTIESLLEEMRKTEAQTLYILENLPADSLDFKGSFMNIYQNFGPVGLPLHTRMHFKQIQDTLTIAKDALGETA